MIAHLRSENLTTSAFCLLAFTLVLPTSEVFAGEWANWRGPDQNRISPDQKNSYIESWDPQKGVEGNLLWKNEDLAGRSTPVVMSGNLYTIIRNQPGTEHEGEKIVCADANTGEVKWEHRFNVYLSDVPDTRVGWSSVTGDPETGRIYALGVCGYFVCLNGKDGSVVWKRSLHEEMGLLSTYGGRTNFPIIYKDTVIISAVVIGWGDSPKWSLMAKPAHRFMAMDKATGEIRWLSGTRLIPYDTTYSTPTITKLGGQEAMVFGSGDGAVWAMQPGTGKQLWKYQISRRGLNVSPAVSPEGHVFAGHSEENIIGNAMGAFFALDGNQLGEGAEPNDMTDKQLWIEYQQMVGKSSPIYYKGRVYAVTDSAKLLVMDAKTGELVTRKALGRVMRSSPLMAGGKIYLTTRGGRVHILRPTEDGVETLSTVSLRREQIDASPIAANGKIYITTSKGLYCLGDPNAEVSSSSKKKKAKKSKINDKRVAQAQLVPWDVLLSPGQEQSYKVRLYNAAGQFLREADPKKIRFGVAGPGEISDSGIYKAPKSKAHQTALILAEVDGVSVRARTRIVPPLPWSFNFDEKDSKVPLTWVGGRIRYVPRESEDGNRYLAKPTELPTRPGAPTTKLGTRSRMWMGAHTLKNYTVRADIQLQQGVAGETIATSDDVPDFPAVSDSAVKLPTAGLINSRYTFALFGPSREARLYSWCTHDKRTQATVKMDLKPGVWYRMKLKVVPNEQKNLAYVRAKVWVRGEAEPEEWTLKFNDEAPNLEGSPGLFGDAKDAEFYVDNLRVTPN